MDKLFIRKIINEPSNPWLIFLHGFCESHVMWETTVHALGKEYNYLLFDLPGFGRSSEIKTENIQEMAKLVLMNIVNQGLESFHLFGHSMGGYLALEIAKLSSGVKSLALVHSTAEADSTEKKRNRQKGIAFIRQHGVKPYLKEFKKKLIGTNHQQNLIVDQVEYAVNNGAVSKEGIMNALQAMHDRLDNRKWLEMAALPILYVIGKNDEFISYRKLHLEACLPKKTTVLFLEKSGHLGFWEEQKNFSRGLRMFLDSVS